MDFNLNSRRIMYIEGFKATPFKSWLSDRWVIMYQKPDDDKYLEILTELNATMDDEPDIDCIVDMFDELKKYYDTKTLKRNKTPF